MTEINEPTLLARLTELEDEKKVRACMNRYMRLCDALDVGFDLDLLMELFTTDATWQGKGGRYAKTFGRHVGKEAVRALFSKYTKAPGHFELNVHFLTSEVINVTGSNAQGKWILLQTSSFKDGRSQLSSAQITAEFRKEAGGSWRINFFQTESLFNRPVSTPWDQPADLPVPDKPKA